ncbi:hypothetical protein ACINK0_02520 [Deinococcus sp. VB343]|uniref:hypothetical protein n=1 Tax=Deinococcus sp. VB343 TaxID=3385567 RepID=UPI0039C98965
MKKSWSFIALVAALAVGTASAEEGPTAAGTKIINEAEITFTPEPTTGNPNPTPETIKTPPVETVVVPVPSFTFRAQG